jgi:hypothetical protein
VRIPLGPTRKDFFLADLKKGVARSWAAVGLLGGKMRIDEQQKKKADRKAGSLFRQLSMISLKA